MAKSIGLNVLVDLSSAKRGFEQIEKGMSKAGSTANKFGSVLGGLGSEMGNFGRIAGTLGAALAAGSVWGAAAVGVTGLIDLLRTSQKEAAELAKKFDDDLARSAERVKAIVDRERQNKLKAQGQDPQLVQFADELVAITQRRQKIINDARKDGRGPNRLYAEEFRQLEELKKAFDEVLKKRAEYVAHHKGTVQAETKTQQKKEADEEAERARKAREAENKRNIEQHKALTQQLVSQTQATEVAALEGKDRLEAQFRLDQLSAAQGQAASLTEIERKAWVEWLEAKKTLYLKNLSDLEDAERERKAKEGQAALDARARQYEADQADQQRELNAAIAEGSAVAQQWGNTLGNAFAQLATGQATVGQVMAQIGQQIIASVTQAAIAQITANAAAAASGAAVSQASIPVIGPVLAISAMGAMLSAVMGLLASVGSASAGAALPSAGGPFPFVLHPNEWVLPAKYAQGLGQMIEEGGSGRGGDTYVTNNYAIDMRSFQKHVISAIADAERNRR